MTTQLINIDIYRRCVVIFQCYTETEIAGWMQQHNADPDFLLRQIEDVDWDSTCAIMASDNVDMYILSKEPMTLPTLCHELSHAALRLLKTIGIDPIEAEEAYAYLYEYLIAQVTSSDDALLPLSSGVTSHTAESQTCPTRHCG